MGKVELPDLKQAKRNPCAWKLSPEVLSCERVLKSIHMYRNALAEAIWTIEMQIAAHRGDEDSVVNGHAKLNDEDGLDLVCLGHETALSPLE